MIEFRQLDLERDRDFMLGVHVLVVFEAERSSERMLGFPRYRDAFMQSTWPRVYWETITEACEDPRTIAEVVEVDGVPAGYVWATPGNVSDSAYFFFQVREIGFKAEFQRQGLGRITMQHVEDLAIERGAVALRSVGIARGDATGGFHRSLGFEPFHIIYEKRLEKGS